MIRRRGLLAGAGVVALLAALTTPAFAATTTVTYQVAYNGDFTTIASALAGIGTDLTASSTGQVTLAGSTTTVINIAVADGSKALVGHAITIGATTCLITSQASNAVTVSAVAGYPAAFGVAPGTGVAYTITDTAAVLNIGQSSSSSNKWDLGTTVVTLGAITTSASDTITLQSATAWNFNAALGPGSLGPTNQAVYITCGGYHQYTLSVTPNFVTIKGLCIEANAAGGVINANNVGNFSFINSMLSQVSGNGTGSLVIGHAGLIKNSIICGPGHGSNGIITTDGTSTNTIYGCTFIGCSIPVNRGYGGSFNPVEACAFLGATNALTTTNITYSGCMSDFVGTPPTGVTTITAGNAVLSQSGGSVDCRPASGGTLLNASPADSTNLPSDLYGASRPSSGTITAGAAQTVFVPPALKAVTWSIAGSGGDFAINLAAATTLQTYCGSNLTFFSTGATCSGTASSHTTIVLQPADATTAAIGHAIQWKSDNICVILSLSTNTATVGALVGSGGTYSASFTGTPQSGDAYTIFPISAKFVLGAPSGGHTIWNVTFATGGSNTGAIQFGTITTSPASSITFTSTAATHSGAAGTFTDGTGFPCIEASGDHMAVFDLGSTDNILFTKFGAWCSGQTGPPAGDGILISSLAVATNIVVDHVIWRGDNFSNDTQHAAIADSENGTLGGFTYQYSVLVGTSSYHQKMLPAGTFNQCTLIETQNGLATVSGGPYSSGTTVVTVSNLTDIYVGASSLNPWLAHPNIPSGAHVTAVNTGTNQVTFTPASTGTINNGDTIYFGAQTEILGNGASSLTNCAIFGVAAHVNGVQTTTYSHCATDANPGAVSGLTTMSYAAQFTSAFQAVTGSIDARPAIGNTLHGGSGATGSDIYGVAFSATDVGAIHPPAPLGGASFFKTVPF